MPIAPGNNIIEVLEESLFDQGDIFSSNCFNKPAMKLDELISV